MKNKTLLLFSAYYFIFFMTDAAMGYFNIYLKSIGYNTLQMGLLTAGASFVALIFQPCIGLMADRSRSKNAVLSVLLLLSAALSPMLLLSASFFYILLVYVVFQVVRHAQRPLSDTIALEYADAGHGSFGRIRMMGCLGYSAMAVLAGKAADMRISGIFWMFSAVCILCVAALLGLPRHKGHQSGRAGISPASLLKNRRLVIMTFYAVIFAVNRSFYHSYFSVYFTGEISGSPSMYGLMLSVGALFEIPFMFFADRIIKKTGIRKALLISGALDALRWLATFGITGAAAQMAIQMLFGVNNMAMAVAMTLTINAETAPELKATGQTTYHTLASLASMLFGSLLGGFLSNVLGIRPVFLIAALLSGTAVAVFIPLSRFAGEETGPAARSDFLAG